MRKPGRRILTFRLTTTLAPEHITKKRKGPSSSLRSTSPAPSSRNHRILSVAFLFPFRSCKHAARAKAADIAWSKRSRHSETRTASPPTQAASVSTAQTFSQDSSATSTNTQPRSAETTSEAFVRTPRRRTRRRDASKRTDESLPLAFQEDSTNTPSWLKSGAP